MTAVKEYFVRKETSPQAQMAENWNKTLRKQARLVNAFLLVLISVLAKKAYKI